MRINPVHKIAFLDFETTGSHEGLRAVEIGLIALENGELVDEFNFLINPGCPIDPISQSVHGISDDDVCYAPGFAEIWDELRPRLSGWIVAAHNAPFDSGVMKNEIIQNRLDPPEMEWWCTLKLARRLWKGRFRSFSLSHLVKTLGIEFPVTHRARDDALAARMLFDLLVDEALLQGYETLPDIRRLARHRGKGSWPWNYPGSCR